MNDDVYDACGTTGPDVSRCPAGVGADSSRLLQSVPGTELCGVVLRIHITCAMKKLPVDNVQPVEGSP